MLKDQFALPVYFDLGATFLYALTGALLAIRRHYDVVGLFVLALVSGLGGGLIRDGVFIQSGPPLAMKDGRYLYAIMAGCLTAAMFRHGVDRLQKGFLLADALGLGAYAVVGVERSLEANLSVMASILVGVINASGGGLLRDVLVREEPLLFKPGQFYVLAALLGASVFTVLIVHFQKPARHRRCWPSVARSCSVSWQLCSTGRPGLCGRNNRRTKPEEALDDDPSRHFSVLPFVLSRFKPAPWWRYAVWPARGRGPCRLGRQNQDQLEEPAVTRAASLINSL